MSRSIPVNVTMKPDVHAELSAAAERAGVTLSQYLRESGLAVARNEADVASALNTLRAALMRAGML